MNTARRQKFQMKADPDVCFGYTLPTPPASPVCIAPALQQENPGKVTIQFPKRLPRPHTKSVRQESLAACDPVGLKEVPIHYIRQALDTLGPQYVFSHVSASCKIQLTCPAILV
jgi:hypothetical protein